MPAGLPAGIGFCLAKGKAIASVAKREFLLLPLAISWYFAQYAFLACGTRGVVRPQLPVMKPLEQKELAGAITVLSFTKRSQVECQG
jgi:hypothetical protein